MKLVKFELEYSVLILHLQGETPHRKISCDQDGHFPFHTRLVWNVYAIKPEF